MRYDATEHLDAWKATGAFPKIHTPVCNMAIQELTSRVILDLGCSYGLLGAQLVRLGLVDEAIGIDISEPVVAAARAAEVPVGLNHLKIERATFPEVLALVRAHRVTGVIARRILPELFGHCLKDGDLFATLLARAGVKEMIVEGRIISPSAKNPLQSIDAEVAMLRDGFREKCRIGAVSYLVAR